MVLNVPPTNALQNAYNTLLSFDKTQDTYLKKNIGATYAKLNYKAFVKLTIACLVTVQPISTNACTMVITANQVGGVDPGIAVMAQTHEFAAEFLRRFSETLEKPNS